MIKKILHKLRRYLTRCLFDSETMIDILTLSIEFRFEQMKKEAIKEIRENFH